jgi:hypothetical protein
MPWTFWDKFTWTQKYYPDIPVWFGPYSQDKHLRVRVAGDILVDDRLDNTTEWREAGGIAVRVTKDYQAALDELASLYNISV